jgi:hypothetical protein
VAARLALRGALITITAVAACGPGLEAMHESNLRFEHCYRLDLDAKIVPQHREHCWRSWAETYAYGQPLDRVDYAHRRVVQLESGDSRLMIIQRDSPGERVFDEFGGGGSITPMAGPAPTSAHEPPPKTAPAPEPPARPSAGAPRPGEACALQCDGPLVDCSRLCGAKHADCATCREEYRGCMRRCFE